MNEDDFIKFAKLSGKLKRIKRTGWVLRGVKNPESVADHSFRTAILAMILSDMRGLNTEKILRMAILHDLEEAITGDIVTMEKEKNKEKSLNKSKNAVRQVISVLPKKLQEKYFDLWIEQEEYRNTLEGKLLKDVDLIEMMIQALEYEEEQPDVDLESFWVRQESLIKDDFLKSVFERLKKMRKTNLNTSEK